MQEYIEIKNANVHNLKNVSVKIPKNKIVVITGVSGSGKSSLAFDTLYAEGQRRYVESLSSYARQFLGLMEKPNVESITGLSPAISIDQKTSGSNPRSTVGTITEIYDYLRLLYARIGQTYCPSCGKLVQSQSIEQIVTSVTEEIKKQILEGNQVKIQILSPLIQNKKGSFSELFERLLSKGFIRVKIDNEIYSLDELEKIKLNKYESHNIDLIIDRLSYSDFEQTEVSLKRLRDAIELASNMSEGEVKILLNEEEKYYSEKNTCTSCNISFPEITPASFSFNSPQGACLKCSGLGIVKEIDIDKIFNPKLSILEGGIFPWSNKTTSDSWTLKLLTAVAKKHKFSLNIPIKDYSKEIFNLIFYGTPKKYLYEITYTNRFGRKRVHQTSYEGIIPEMERRYKETASEYSRMDIEKYMIERECDLCNGKRLKPYSLAVRINDKNINELCSLPIDQAKIVLEGLKLSGMKSEIASPIIKEILSRINFLLNVGLSYLSLNRRSNTLSGGESQRIRLASQIGTGLTGVLYVLDEPSIGLHPRDVNKLIDSLKHLRDLGNTVIIVEHDKETIDSADWLVDVGPLAGNFGGSIVAEGTISQVKQSNTITANYLSGVDSVGQDIKKEKNLFNNEDTYQSLTLKGVKTHNLNNITIELPLGKLICITGVSGSGKSSLVNDTLIPAIEYNLSKGEKSIPKEAVFSSLKGMETITKLIAIDQSPIGRTPKSNPVTYTGVFNFIRELYASLPESKARGYSEGRFSFNVRGGRCETCKGEGQIRIEMQFLPDMYVTCDQCHGKRYNEDALEIDYKGKNIADILDMTVSEALTFFENIPHINRKMKLLEDVGLGYIQLGQPAPYLSGGESQRIKLAKELSKVTRGHTIYILDEPTTGLHFYDVDKLLHVVTKLVDKGNTVIIVEHNLDVIKFADWIIDLGPEGGDKGGKILYQGELKGILNVKNSWTGKFLKKVL